MTPDRDSCRGVMSPGNDPLQIKELRSMENVWVLAALWVGLALIATLLAIWFRISTALTEIVVGTVAQLVIGGFYQSRRAWGKDGLDCFLGGNRLRSSSPFLLAPNSIPRSSAPNGKKRRWWGWSGFFGPFFGCTAIAHYVLHWATRPSWLAGVALEHDLGRRGLRGNAGTRASTRPISAKPFWRLAL